MCPYGLTTLKKKLLPRIYKLRVSTCITFLLFCLTLAHLFESFPPYYNYDYVPLEVIQFMLYYERSTKLVLKEDNADCNYTDILNSGESIQPWDIPEKFDSFNASGIINGSFVPEECNPRFSTALLVPLKNRQAYWNKFLPYMHNFLRKQRIHYRIYLIEQQDNKNFNKGVLFNLGAKQAFIDEFPCLILHDVDVLPLDDSNLYVCAKYNRHMSASVDQFRNNLLYDYLVGGALAIKTYNYVEANGFSNRFEGWGGEDDEFAHRLQTQNQKLIRFPRKMSRYAILYHPPAALNAERHKIMRENETSRYDEGLNTVSYFLLNVTVENKRLFTHIRVQLL